MAMNSLQNPTQFEDLSSSFMDLLDFSGYPLPDFWLEPEPAVLPEATIGGQSRSMEEATSRMDKNSIDEWRERRDVKREQNGRGGGCHKVAFRTKSELEILQDGFKWRKYGKKSIKNNPNPRNYYKCLSSGCRVKKRVERDREDSSYVITTYEGIHSHESPITKCCNDPIFHSHGSCPNSTYLHLSSPPSSSTTTL
ncbi:probable WRKY transcription factor 51 [Cucurbita maxima]|uniref:Probable WRKY transcription factor 51 n=1 Tax=Cucurbita maxima TaxID=3661 RepID=A0A6J1KRV9_CUCMA|nr:probable WRKY transcription factor 51 [Cucurbita maxima]